ncbi:MAG: TraR/DksA family transcriptional regulator [Treponema sp.]
MDNAFIEKMKNLLLEEKQNLLSSISRNEKEFEDGIKNASPKDFADIASYASDQDLLDVLGAQNVKKIQAIDAALLRIEENRYGKCVKCSKDISEDRLNTLPYAIKCIACQTVDERRH